MAMFNSKLLVYQRVHTLQLLIQYPCLCRNRLSRSIQY